MKNLLLIALYISFSHDLKAQTATVMSPEANEFYVNTMPVMRQQLKDIILQTATSIRYRKPNADSLSQRLLINKALKGMNNNDIEGIIVLIMVQASKDADAELKLLVLGMSRRTEQKQQQSTGQTVSANGVENKSKSTEEIHDVQNAKLQLIVERKRMMAEEINAVMEKISGTQQSITANLK